MKKSKRTNAKKRGDEVANLRHAIGVDPWTIYGGIEAVEVEGPVLRVNSLRNALI